MLLEVLYRYLIDEDTLQFHIVIAKNNPNVKLSYQGGGKKKSRNLTLVDSATKGVCTSWIYSFCAFLSHRLFK